MDESRVIALEKPGSGEKDALTEVLREGARTMLAQAIEAEVEVFLCAHSADVHDDISRRVYPVRLGRQGRARVQLRAADWCRCGNLQFVGRGHAAALPPATAARGRLGHCRAWAHRNRACRGGRSDGPIGLVRHHRGELFRILGTGSNVRPSPRRWDAGDGVIAMRRRRMGGMPRYV